MWWLSALALAAAPWSPGAVPLTNAEALARVDAVDDVVGAAKAAQVLRDGQHASILTSNPQLSAQPAVRLENAAARFEGQLSLTQSFNLGGLGLARAEVQRGEARLAALEHRLLRQERRLAVITAWHELWAAQQAATLAHDEEANAREVVVRLERARVDGAATRVELAAARAFAAELAALHLEWEGRRVEAGATVADLLGLPSLAVAAGAPADVAAVEFSAASVADQLQVQRSRDELELERARLDEVAAQWAPQLQVSLLGGHDAPAQWFAAAGLGLSLPVFEQGRRERTNHHAALGRRAAALELAGTRAAIRLEVAAHELEHTAETLRVLADAQLPAAEEAVALEATRFELHEATLLELTVLRRQALAARIAKVLARGRAAAARARAWELEPRP